MSKLHFFAAVLALLVTVTGCAPAADEQVAAANVVEMLSGAVPEGYARAYEPMEFVFPDDHGPHDEYQTEWWYYTGNLTGAGGDEYGFQLTFFRSAIQPDMPARESGLASNQVYMGHFALTDARERDHQSFELFSRGAGGLAGAQGSPHYAVWIEDWSAEEIEPGVVELQATAQGEAGPVGLNLTLRETRDPIYHGDAGLSQKGPEPGNASYYYSLVGLESTGTVTINGRTDSVTGVSWMDHEFGTSALSENALGWDWFSVQLNNGAVLMFAQIRTEDGGRIGDFEGTLVFPDGRQSVIASEDFTISVLDEWSSPRTGITYPSGWQVSLPKHELTLDILPIIPNQEMNVSYVYWEGAINAVGEIAGESVAGRGYVELTGYGAGQAGYQR